MAVKEKNPTPTQPKKIEEVDLNLLKQLQSDTDKLVYSLGQLYVSKEKLSQTENTLKVEIQKMEQREVEIGKKLSSKYGIGTVDIESGTFNPKS